MKHFLLLVFLLAAQTAFAQKFSIKGKILDEKESPLPGATILILQEKDSSLVNYSTTDGLGSFGINNINKGTYLLKATFVGFVPYFKTINPPTDKNQLDLGFIKMVPVAAQLNEIQVQGERNPIVFKKDTVEYNAGSFTTQPNANVEELLKKLPGIEVETDGSVKAQGETVTKITVDGKAFFGGNMQMATKNLPADAIDKVQVVDQKSEAAKFSGVEDGQREKVINLKLKKDRRKMGFGKATGGVGTDQRYSGKAIYNKFDNGNQLSFLGMTNNVNETGFSFQEQYEFSGGTQRRSSNNSVNYSNNGLPTNFGNNRNGLNTTAAAGINFFNQLNKKLSVNGSYALNRGISDIINESYNENYRPNNPTLITFSDGTSANRNIGHSGNMIIEYKDSLNTARLTATTGYNIYEYASNSYSRQEEEGIAEPLTLSRYINNSESNNYNINSTFFLGHRFQKKGRFITTTTRLTKNLNNSEAGSVNNITRRGSITTDTERQNINETDNFNYGVQLAYTEPLGKRKYLQANYNFSNRRDASDFRSYDVMNDRLQLNEFLSNLYSTGYLYQQVGLTFRMNRDNFNLNIGANGQRSELSRKVELKDGNITRNFRNILPLASFRYSFSRYKSLDIEYRTSMQEPQVHQLQPIVNNLNELYIYEGNPNLRPTFRHQNSLFYNSYVPGKNTSFYANVNYTYTTNPIVNSVTINEGVRTSRYVNVANESYAYSSIGYNFQINKIHRISIGPQVNLQQRRNMFDGVVGNVNQQGKGGNVGYTLRLNDFANFSLKANLNFGSTNYDFESYQNQTFITNNYTATTYIKFLKKFNFNADFNYYSYNSSLPNSDLSIPLLNFSLSRFVLADNKGEVKLTGTNLLNKNLGINQYAYDNYSFRNRTNSIGRYIMLSFTYSLSNAVKSAPSVIIKSY